MQYRKNNWEMKMATVEQVYGKAAAMRLRTEKLVMEQFTVIRFRVESQCTKETHDLDA